MTVRLAAGAVAATCSVILLASCSGGSGSSTEQGASTPAAATPSASATSSMSMPMSSGPSTPAAGGSSAAAGQTTATDSTATAKITIKDFKYQVPTTVKPGQKITVTNSDNVNHTVTSDKDGGFDAIVESNGGTKTFTAPTKPGKYPFHCTYHANMHATLVVS